MGLLCTICYDNAQYPFQGKQTMALRYIDLFAGLGGFHLALSKLGHQCVFASELRDDLRKLYKINFPELNEKHLRGDITQVKVEDIPTHDILCGGFPCQPFSQAGKRLGFKDSGRGDLFFKICEIIQYHRPRYIFLENVSNLKGHDNGDTWKVIKRELEELEYFVPDPEILSPHQFGIPQHRKRIYIVAIDTHQVDNPHFEFPEPTREECDITRYIDEDDADYMALKPETRKQLELWQEFIDETVAHGHEIPSFPIWAMEFGADYPIDIAPAFLEDPDTLIGRKGKLGRTIPEGNLGDCLAILPKYAQSDKSKKFPLWKIKYIEQNRNFYEENRTWLDKWLTQVKKFENSHLKMEWNCGKNATPTIEDKIIQFRASGIRIKLPNFSPALNLVGTQVPILPWVTLPKETLLEGEPAKGRYMTVREAAKLQGMQDLKFGDDDFRLSQCRCYEALGNAVNVDIVKLIAEKLLHDER